MTDSILSKKGGGKVRKKDPIIYEMDYDALDDAIKRSDKTFTAMARHLGITRAGLWYKVKNIRSFKPWELASLLAYIGASKSEVKDIIRGKAEYHGR